VARLMAAIWLIRSGHHAASAGASADSRNSGADAGGAWHTWRQNLRRKSHGVSQ
jgi:hypothetical protein